MSRQVSPPEFFGSGEAARRLGVSTDALRRAVRSGALSPARTTPGGRLRFSAHEIDQYARRLRRAVNADATRSARRSGGPLDDSETLRLIYGSMASGVVLNGPTGAVLYANEAAERMFGLSVAQMQGRAPLDRTWHATNEDGTPITAENYPAQIVLRSGQAQREIAICVQVREDLTRWLQHDAVPVVGADGAVTHVVTNLTDITRRMQAEERLRVLEAAVVHARDGVVITEVDPEQSRLSPIVYVNDAFSRMSGYARDEVIGHPPGMLDGAQTDREAIDATYGALLAGVPSEAELLTYRKDGSTYWADYSVVPVRDSRERITHWISYERDVSERRATMEALRAKEAQLRTVLMNAPVILSSIDAQGIFQVSAGGAQSRLGYASSDRLGKSIHQLFEADSDVIRYFKRALGGEAHSQHVDVNGVCLDVTWAPWRDAAGAIVGVISMGFDITERMRAQRDSERARHAADELAGIRNDFIAAVSHELRTPLTAIIGYAELLEARWGVMDDTRRHEQLRRIVSAANRQQRLVDDLLMVGRLDDVNLAPTVEATSLPAICELAADEVRASYRGQVIRTEGPPDLLVAVDSGRLIQILVNLIDNAAKYSHEGSPVFVTWKRRDDVVDIRVRDQGSGIEEAHLPRLFTRFGRLPGSKARNGHVGTGLGLYLGRLLAEAMHGSLVVESTGATGTVFCLCLPVADIPSDYRVPE